MTEVGQHQGGINACAGKEGRLEETEEAVIPQDAKSENTIVNSYEVFNFSEDNFLIVFYDQIF